MYNKAGVSSPIYFWAAGTVGQWGLRRVRAKTGKTFIIFQPHSLVGVLNMLGWDCWDWDEAEAISEPKLPPI